MSSSQAQLLIQQGHQHFDRGEYVRAIARFEQAVAQAYSVGDTLYELNGWGNMAAAWINLGEYAKAIEAATRLLARARQATNGNYEMYAARLLAVALANLDLRGRWREIRPLLLEGLDTAQRLGNRFQEVSHLNRLGESAVKVGELEQGLSWLQRALNAIDPNLEAVHYHLEAVYAHFSFLMRKRGDADEAVRYAEMALGEARHTRSPDSLTHAQLMLAWAERERGERLEALRLVEEVNVDAAKLGWKYLEQEGEWLRAELERELGHSDVAEQAAKCALELAREMQLKEEEVESLLTLGQTLVAQGNKDEAREMLRQARRLSQERDYSDHFERAKHLLSQLES